MEVLEQHPPSHATPSGASLKPGRQQQRQEGGYIPGEATAPTFARHPVRSESEARPAAAAVGAYRVLAEVATAVRHVRTFVHVWGHSIKKISSILNRNYVA